MKINKAYSNKALIEALKDRDITYESMINELNTYNTSDEEFETINRIKLLTQYQKDLLYLSTTRSVYDVADLYGVSATYLYKHLREIRKILKNEDL